MFSIPVRSHAISQSTIRTKMEIKKKKASTLAYLMYPFRGVKSALGHCLLAHALLFK